MFSHHRSNPRTGQKPRSWERLSQSSPWYGLEEAASVAELPATRRSSQSHRTCTGRKTNPQQLRPHILTLRREWVIPLPFRTLRSPKTGTRQCSNRYTKYPVSPSHGFHFVDVCFVHHVVLLASKLFCVCFYVCGFFYVMSHCVLSPHRCTQSLSRKTLIAPPTLSLRTMTFRWNQKVPDGSYSSLSGATNPKPFCVISNNWAVLNLHTWPSRR